VTDYCGQFVGNSAVIASEPEKWHGIPLN